ncbi:protein RoBo-1 isoform X2 [Fukomys damarensis]|uniref:protein RoBo-1 isoform X2 n=1 Tax=Fukomys damarensis TaxID=885580 RepID=UPI00145594E2|nr:protein RoBo-1 isoform X2 [Fukomys damarensis]
MDSARGPHHPCSCDRLRPAAQTSRVPALCTASRGEVTFLPASSEASPARDQGRLRGSAVTMLWPSNLKTVFALCVSLAFLVTTVESYECISCSGGQCRSNPTATCTTSQGCFSLQQELNISGQQILLAQDKGCSSGACSALAFSVTLGEKRAFRYDRRCCDGQRCNKENVTLSLKSSKPNGIECPACYNATGLSCTPVQLQCTGEETKCIEVVGTVTVNRIPYFALFGMGCATASACQLDLSVLNGTSVRSYCAGPNSGSPPLMSIISAILPGLFLLKVLL